MQKSGSEGGSSGGWAEDAVAAAAAATATPGAGERKVGWEVRVGGLLVQKRSEEAGSPTLAAPLVRVRVAYGAARHEVSVSSVATVGDLKKLLVAKTGLQPADQRLMYRGKERGNGEYLDVCGVKNRSKIVLAVDPMSLERRYIEMQKNARLESVKRVISGISLEVDRLADQVTAIEKSISNGSKVAEVQITTLVELLMRQAIKLESIPVTEGDASSQKNIQCKRVQKCVENLDVLKISNARLNPVVVTTKWERFDTPTTAHWEFFD